MTAEQFQKFITWHMPVSISTDYTARKAADACGLFWFRHKGRIVVECSDMLVELYWMNRARTWLGVREAAC